MYSKSSLVKKFQPQKFIVFQYTLNFFKDQSSYAAISFSEQSKFLASWQQYRTSMNYEFSNQTEKFRNYS